MLEEIITPLGRPHQDTSIEVSTEEENFENSEVLEKATAGDLYFVGKLWINLLQKGLLGTKWKLPPLLPVVQSAAPPPPPQKPPKMKYKDLPLTTAPHYEYKDYLEDKPKCPALKRRLIHEKVLPYVKCARKDMVKRFSSLGYEINAMKNEALCAFHCKKNEFFCYMRSCKNLRIRQGVLALGTATGFLLSRKYKGRTTPRFVYPAIGLLAAGALCFPEETDEAFRNISLETGKFILTLYNRYCNKNAALKERLACPYELPKPPPPAIANKCPQKK